MSDTVHIKINAPDKTTPGHLQRQKRVVALQRRQKSLAREQRSAQRELAARNGTELTDEQKDSDDARDEKILGELDLLLDETVEFLAGYVVEPSDPQAIRAAILQANEAEIYSMFAAVSGGEVPLEAKPNDANSAIG